MPCETNCVTLGPPIVKMGTKVDAEGRFTIDLGKQKVLGAANPISGSDITATILLAGARIPA